MGVFTAYKKDSYINSVVFYVEKSDSCDKNEFSIDIHNRSPPFMYKC